MIGKLRGRVDTIGESYCIVDVGGVGYEVSCSGRTLRDLEVGQVITLTIETHVREDAIRLFGFATEEERAWFRLLQSVQGVGSKVALGVLSTFAPQDIANAIALADKAMIARAPSIGPKLALRIVTELKDKAPALMAAGLSLPAAAFAGKGGTVASSAAAEAISALTNLGYQPVQASAAIAKAMKDAGDAADTARLIRLGLKELAR